MTEPRDLVAVTDAARTDLMVALREGKLEQACPTCGRWEAAGSYCSKCSRPMGPVDWYRNGDQDRRQSDARVAAEKATTPPKAPRGRPRRVIARLDLGLLP